MVGGHCHGYNQEVCLWCRRTIIYVKWAGEIQWKNRGWNTFSIWGIPRAHDTSSKSGILCQHG